ncbi:MAG: peptidylprolyl isomerase [Bacteroidota bacterium]
MAILSKIREKTVFLIIIIALALFSFVLADVINQGGFSGEKTQNVIGSVGDQEIDRQLFSRQVESAVQNSGGQVSTLQAVNRVWDAEIRRSMLKQEFKALGLQASSEEIIDYMAQQLDGDPRFSDQEGFFDENKMIETVANMKANSPQEYEAWKNYENNVEIEVLTQMYFNMIKAGMGVTEFEARQLYKKRNDNLTFEFVQIPYSQGGEVEVSKSDIRTYINNNKDQFEQKAERDIQYVHFSEKPSAQDEKNAKTEIESRIKEFKSAEDNEDYVNAYSDESYNANFRFEYEMDKDFDTELIKLNVGEVYGPYKDKESWKISKMEAIETVSDSASVNHILITETENRSLEEAQKLADSLLTEINNNKDKFSELAAEFSDDQQTAEEGGELGEFKYGSLPDELNKPIFEANEGDFKIVEMEYGYHIFHISRLTEPKKAYKVATIAHNIEASEETLNELYRKASNFTLAARDSDFVDAAENEDLEVKPVNNIQELDERISGIGNQRNIIRWAFENETQVGETKMFDTNDGHVVAQLVESRDEGVMSAEEAASKVNPILKKRQQAKKIMAKISSTDIDEIATSFSVSKERASSVNIENPILPGVGEEPAVVGAGFALNINDVSSPIEGNKGVFVVKLLKKEEATDLPSYAGVAKEETNKRTRNLTGNNSPVIEALKSVKEIQDNRADFY